MKDSYNIIFLDINNIISDEIVEIKDGEELKPEVKENFEFITSIINQFIDNHILVDVENEENFIFQLTSFIFQVETGLMKKYKFYLFRQLNESINIDIDALFIIINLEKEYSKDLVIKLIEDATNNSKIKIYALGYYNSVNDIVITKDKIESLFTDQEQKIDFKYNQINITNGNMSYINDIINKYIEKMMLDIYSEEKGKMSDELVHTESLARHDSNSDSHCVIL